jgi:serine/threonine protein kinase
LSELESDKEQADQSLEQAGNAAERLPLLSEIIAQESQKSENAAPPRSVAERWEIMNRLGQGGMSTVYKARHKVMNKICAVKILNYNLTSKKESLQRFQREAKAASSLNHPNVISVMDCGVTSENHAFLIMDYLEGESLSEAIKREAKLSATRALPIFLQTCDAVAHAHERSVIHRDLKPSNLMLIEHEGQSDFVKILDFGIAKLLDVDLSPNDETHQRLTYTGDVFGSPLYMSPEQCAGSESDQRSDIYSMGCLMYETLCGVPPFVGANTLDTMRLKLSDTPAPTIDGKSDRLLRRLNTVIQKCLQKEADDRYASMLQLRADLILARDESESGWQAKALANRKKLQWSWLNITPKKVAAVVFAAIVISIGTTVLIDSANSDVPSAYENKSLWNLKPYVVSNAEAEESAEAKDKRLINKFAEADKMRLNHDYHSASQTYTQALKQWNNNEAEDLPGANWAVCSSKAYFGLALCKAKEEKFQEANDCYQQALDLAKKDKTTPMDLYIDMNKMLERNQWKVNPVKAILRVLSNQEMLPPGAS